MCAEGNKHEEEIYCASPVTEEASTPRPRLGGEKKRRLLRRRYNGEMNG